MVHNLSSTNVHAARFAGTSSLSAESSEFLFSLPSSCSLNCFKSHQTQCEPSPGGQSGVTESVARTFGPEDTVPGAPKVNSEEALEIMFVKYPKLRSKLKSIYNATLDPGPTESNQRGRFVKAWSDEQALAHGMAELQRQLESGTANSDDIKAFSAYVAAKVG